MPSLGYARVSTDGQDLSAQVAALRAAGCEKVHAEKISGAVTERPELTRLICHLQPDDVCGFCHTPGTF